MRCWLLRCLLVLAFVSAQSGNAQPLVSEGLIDLREWDFSRKGEVKLDGRWNFYWQSLRAPAALDAQPKDRFEFPGIWNDAFSDHEELNGQGFATYEARVLLDKDLEMVSF